MFGGSKKPFTAVTAQIDRLTSNQFEEDDIVGIPDLVEVIRLQDTGPTEAARAIRKKLKYGNMHQQIRALVILDGLIQNAGSRFQRTFADEPLLERLRIIARDDMVDADVRARSNILFRQWAHHYKDTPGLSGIANLYKQLPKQRAQPSAANSKVLRDTEAQAQRDIFGDSPGPSSPVSTTSSPTHARKSSTTSTPLGASHKKTPSGSSSNFFKNLTKPPSQHASGGVVRINLEKEKPILLATIAEANVASTNLLNGLKLINRESGPGSVSADPKVAAQFDECKDLRRRIIRYIRAIESEEFLGGLISANDELVKALTAYEIMDKSISDDSDSEAEAEGGSISGSGAGGGGSGAGSGGVNSRHQIDHHLAREAHRALNMRDEDEGPAPPKPPRPASGVDGIGSPTSARRPHRAPLQEPEEEEEEEDEDNPFGDQNATG